MVRMWVHGVYMKEFIHEWIPLCTHHALTYAPFICTHNSFMSTPCTHTRTIDSYTNHSLIYHIRTIHCHTHHSFKYRLAPALHHVTHVCELNLVYIYVYKHIYAHSFTNAPFIYIHTIHSNIDCHLPVIMSRMYVSLLTYMYMCTNMYTHIHSQTQHLFTYAPFITYAPLIQI